MDTVAEIIAREVIEKEKDPKIRKRLNNLMQIFEYEGYLPSLTDWEMMSEKEQQEIIGEYKL